MNFIFIPLFVSVLSFANSDNDQCISSSTTIPIDIPDHLSYLRVCPDGQFLVATTSAGAVLIRLDFDPSTQSYTSSVARTPLQNEAYPTPNCDYISSPYDGENRQDLNFFRLEDLVAHREQAQRASSSSFNEYYNSVGGNPRNFRILNWNYMSSHNFSTITGAPRESGGSYTLCNNLFNLSPSETQRVNRYLERQTVIHNTWENAVDMISADPTLENDIYLHMQSLVGKNSFTQEDMELSLFHKQLIVSGRYAQSVLQQPILSPSGSSVAGNYQGSMRVFDIAPDPTCRNSLCSSNTCRETNNLGVETSKVSFSHKGGRGANSRYIAFHGIYATPEDYGDNVTMIYDRQTNQRYQIDIQEANPQGIFSPPSYPGFSEDGRLFYTTRANMQTNLTIVDPHQITNGGIYNSCIKVSEISRRSTTSPNSTQDSRQ